MTTENSPAVKTSAAGNKINPCLWFDGQAQAAAEFYTSVFPNSSILTITRSEKYACPAARAHGDSVLTVSFTIQGQRFIALNAGPNSKFTPAISFYVYCDSQAEIDRYWNELTDGGTELQCGWLTDKFGISWQIVPGRIFEMLEQGTPRQFEAVMAEVVTMVKLDMAKITEAFNSGKINHEIPEPH